MAKTWYPVIDYVVCKECGACVQKCSHGVYNARKAPTPAVAFPESCVDHCHGCGNLCPVGAITYVGDDTGWTPKNGTKNPEPPCCSRGCAETSANKGVVEYLYLDLQSCDRCMGTEHVLDEVMTILTPALRLAGYEVEYRKVEMRTAELAERFQFLSSPTVRVNGQDICGSVRENNCGCCGEISGTDVDCRVFEYKGETYEVPPKEMLAEAVLRTLFGSAESACFCGGEYRLPENLKAFYDGKRLRSCGSCGDSCC